MTRRSGAAAEVLSPPRPNSLSFAVSPSLLLLFSQLSGGGGPGVLLSRCPAGPTTPVRRASGLGRGGGVSGSSSRFRRDGWTDLGATNRGGLVVPALLPSSGEEVEPAWVRRRWLIRSLTDCWLDEAERKRSFCEPLFRVRSVWCGVLAGLVKVVLCRFLGIDTGVRIEEKGRSWDEWRRSQLRLFQAYSKG